jgi:hypothetical protein
MTRWKRDPDGVWRPDISQPQPASCRDDALWMLGWILPLAVAAVVWVMRSR